MEPTNQFAKYLFDNYQISNKYSSGSKLLKDHKFIINRFFNPRDYCTVYINQQDQSSFMIKLTKPRKLKFIVNLKLEKRSIYFKRILHFKFIVDEKKTDQKV